MKKILLMAAAAATALASWAVPGHKLTYRILEMSSPQMAAMNPLATNGVRTIEVYVAGNKSAVVDLNNSITNIYDLDKGTVTVVAPRLHKAVTRPYDAKTADQFQLLKQLGGQVTEDRAPSVYHGTGAIHTRTQASMGPTNILNESLALDTALVLPEAFHASMGFQTHSGVPVKISSVMSMNGEDALKQATRLVKIEQVDVPDVTFTCPPSCSVVDDVKQLQTILVENAQLPKEDSNNAAAITVTEFPAFNYEWDF